MNKGVPDDMIIRQFIQFDKPIYLFLLSIPSDWWLHG